MIVDCYISLTYELLDSELLTCASAERCASVGIVFQDLLKHQNLLFFQASFCNITSI